MFNEKKLTGYDQETPHTDQPLAPSGRNTRTPVKSGLNEKSDLGF